VLWKFSKKFFDLLEDDVVRKEVVQSLFKVVFNLEESCAQSCKRAAAAFSCLFSRGLAVSMR